VYIKRIVEDILVEYAKFPVVALVGPRQSGKTTLASNYFPKHTYLSLEDLELRTFASTDPKRFLATYENKYGLILDEFQHVPDILSYIQLEVDQKKRPGYFVLTGSQNFLVNNSISQSLAGRVGILTLLPFAINELISNSLQKATVDEVLFNGCYPRIFDEHLSPSAFYQSYIQTYVERDVRALINVGNLLSFQKFMALCAGRTGQQLNLTEIASTCNIDRKTAESWLSILEASYIIFRLPPFFNNYNKRLTKTPKIYFYDTGLACALLGIKNAESLSLSPWRGPLFENFIIADFYKQSYNAGNRPSIYFWRDQNGRIEVDCIVDNGGQLTAIEIKASETAHSDYFKQIIEWQSLANQDGKECYVIYGGQQKQLRGPGTLIGWQEAGDLLNRPFLTLE
jgi:predicted AAA+ superfamily ATPase